MNIRIFLFMRKNDFRKNDFKNAGLSIGKDSPALFEVELVVKTK